MRAFCNTHSDFYMEKTAECSQNLAKETNAKLNIL